MSLTRHRRGASTGKNGGYLQWSLLDSQIALRIPFSDLLRDGRCDSQHVHRVRYELDMFERELAARHANDPLPALPTPNSVIIDVDQEALGEFQNDLAGRLATHLASRRADQRP
jgi:hypothetical protein